MLPDRADFRRLATLALPVITVQVGLMAMGVVDTIMVGHVSAADLGGRGARRISTCSASCGFGMGTLMALDPVVAQAVGAGDEPAVARAIQRGILLGAGAHACRPG